MTIERIVSSLISRPFSRIIVCVTIWMTWRVTVWAFEFANSTSHIGGYETAAILAAITAPFAALQAAIFKVYTDGKLK